MAVTAGTETRVSTYTAGDQRAQQITVLKDGGWVVTWQSSTQDNGTFGVYQQLYSASGAKDGIEIRVNSFTDSDQSNPKITALTNGGWVVAWNSFGQETLADGELASTGVYQQAFGAGGGKVGGETQVNVATQLNQQDPVLSALDGGGWATAWLSQEDNGSPFGILRPYLRIYNASGTSITGEIAIGASIAGQLSAPQLTTLSNGNIVAIWSTSGSNTEVYQQVFSPTGTTVSSTAQVNTFTAGNQTDARVEALKGGGWVVTWTSTLQDGDDRGTYQQAYAANGAKAGGETLVNSTIAGPQYASQVTTLDGGGWVVIWQAGELLNKTPLYQQAFDANGNKIGGETQITGPGTVIPQHQIVALVGGGWVVVWNGADVSGTGIMLQVFAANGSKIGGVQTVNTTTNGNQALDAAIGSDHSKIAALPSGGFVVTWVSVDQDGSGYGVYQKIFSIGSGAAPTNITGTLKIDEGKSGTVGTLVAVDPDSSSGFTWRLMDDAGGRFKINATTGKVTVAAPTLLDYEQATKHSIIVQVTDSDGNSYTKKLTVSVGDVASENLTGTKGADILFGGSKKDIFNGSDGDDFIRGGGGKDILDGGKGVDTADYSDKTAAVEVKLNGATKVAVKVGGVTEDSIANFENVLGGSAGDKLTGDALANRLEGNGGKDILLGGKGNDVLAGGLGNDTLTGGSGKDYFVFATKLGTSNIDTITDFVAKDDTIQLDDAIFKALGATGTLAKSAFVANLSGVSEKASDRIIYETDTGKLFYDADGTGSIKAIQFAVLTTKPTLTHLDFEII